MLMSHELAPVPLRQLKLHWFAPLGVYLARAGFEEEDQKTLDQSRFPTSGLVPSQPRGENHHGHSQKASKPGRSQEWHDIVEHFEGQPFAKH